MDREYLHKDNSCPFITMEEKMIKLNDYLDELSILDVADDDEVD